MIKLQYKVITIKSKSYEEIEVEINEIANKGWELISFSVQDVGGLTVTVWKKT